MRSDKFGSQLDRKSKTWFFIFLNTYVSWIERDKVLEVKAVKWPLSRSIQETNIEESEKPGFTFSIMLRINCKIFRVISWSNLTHPYFIHHPMTILVFCRVRTIKFLLELKECLLIMRDKPSLNRNLTSASLYLFDKP